MKKGGRTALMEASKIGHLDVINRLLDWKKSQISAQIREGFNLAYVHDSLCFPVDLVEMIVDFAVLK